MADITLDTTSAQYQQLLNGLATLRTEIGPRVKMLKMLRDRGEDDKIRRLLQRDPLLRRTIKMSQGLVDFLDLDADG